MHQKISFILFVLALVLLVPGLIQPMLTLQATVNKKEMLEMAAQSLFPGGADSSMIAQFAYAMIGNMQVEGTMQIFNKTRSVLGTMSDLIKSGHHFVGFLIGLFAVVIPAIKVCLTGIAALIQNQARRQSLDKLSGLISKWSMSDVFVMAMIVGYLAANADDNPADAVKMNAELGPGFYYFAAYCLTSILSAQVLRRRSNENSQAAMNNSSSR